MELMSLEQWKDIKGYEGLYQVSNYGRVKRKYNNGKIRILKPISTNNGYLRVSLSKNSVNNTYFVHRLVAQAFILNPENKPEVNHIDGDKTNNKIENLEWCTRSENIQHAFYTGLNQIDPALIGKSGSKPVRCITTNIVSILQRQLYLPDMQLCLALYVYVIMCISQQYVLYLRL